MKKLLNISLLVLTSVLLSACMGNSYTKHNNEASSNNKEFRSSVINVLSLDVKELCNVDKNGIDKVISTAKKYNKIAQDKDLEFRRLNVDNSALITSVEEAIKTGKKEVNPLTHKGKKSKTKLATNFAATRSCHFAIRALQQADEGKQTWRLAVPGDGYKY